MKFTSPHMITKKFKSVKATKSNNKQVFLDKIVDQRTNPTLFNVESARASLAMKTGPASTLSALRTPARIKNQGAIATDVLAQMNVMMVDIDRNYSLLESDSDKDALENPFIMDRVEYKNTVNNTVTAEDKFIFSEDPFYQLDEMPAMNRDFSQPVSTLTKEKISPADPSMILSNLTILNGSPTYFGKNKYF